MKKYNEVNIQIQNAKIDKQKECSVQVPRSEIKVDMDLGKEWKDMEVNSQTIYWQLHTSPPERKDQLTDFLYNHYPNLSIGSWSRVAQQLLNEGYRLHLDRESVGGGHFSGFVGKLTISW